MRILFLSTRQTKPSFRFRVEQMLPCFRAAGHQCDVEFLPRRVWPRLKLCRRAEDYDAVFLQKRLLGRLELTALRRVPRLVYDLDDAVMYDGFGRRDRRRVRRFAAVVRAADLTICGNSHLADLTARAGGRTAVVPTAIDTDLFHRDNAAESRGQETGDRGQGAGDRGQKPEVRAQKAVREQRTTDNGQRTNPDPPKAVTVGWTGSRSTIRYLNDVLDVLASLAGRIRLKIISDGTDGLQLRRIGSVPVEFVRWSPETEAAEAAGFDIGLMPLPDDPWTRGKCGFKALQYMALGVPAVCSPVGVNREIVQHGQSGFLPRSRDEWRSTLNELIGSPELRTRIGGAGRRRVEVAYSLRVIGPKLVNAVVNGRGDSLRKSA